MLLGCSEVDGKVSSLAEVNGMCVCGTEDGSVTLLDYRENEMVLRNTKQVSKSDVSHIQSVPYSSHIALSCDTVLQIHDDLLENVSSHNLQRSLFLFLSLSRLVTHSLFIFCSVASEAWQWYLLRQSSVALEVLCVSI